ncbi:MAG: hypothetical protein FAZ92_01705 [Accumulibacter sp.]|nr:MAG: hypothetical protein FAZ92_01705 [Accumulibacter sp.]
MVAGTQRTEQAFGGSRRFPAVGCLEQDDELVATEPRHRVFGTDTVEQPHRRLFEQSVAGDVTKGVVDDLEVVEVDEDYAHALVRALGARQGEMQAVVEQRPVGQSGQLVVRRQVLDALLRLAHLGDVAEHADIVHHLAVLVLYRVDRQPLEERLAALAPVPDLALPDTEPVDALPHVLIELRRCQVGAQQVWLLADGFLTGEAGEDGEGIIDRQDALLGVGDHHSFGRTVEDHRCQPQAVFCLLARGDVGGLETEAGDRAIVIQQREAHGQEVTWPARQRQRLLALDSLPQADRFEFTRAEDLADLGREELQVGLANDLAGGETEGRLELRIGELVAPGSVLDGHQRDRVVHHGEQPHLRLARRALDLVEVRVVGKQEDDAGDALRVAQQRHDVHRVVAAVGIDDLAVERVLCLDHLLAAGDQIGHSGRQLQVAQVTTVLGRIQLEQPRSGAVETLQAEVAVDDEQRVVDAVLDALKFDVEFLRLGGLDLQFLVDRRQLPVGRLQFLVRCFEFLVRGLHLLVRRLDFLVQRLHLLVRGLEFLDDRLQVLAGRREFILQFLVGAVVVGVLDGTPARRRLDPFDADHEQCFAAHRRQWVHRQAEAARGVERLDVARPSEGDRLLHLRLAHQHLHLGAQLAPDQRDQVEGRLARRYVEQSSRVAVDVADLELAVDEDAGGDEVTSGGIEQDVLESQWRRRLGDSLVLVETGCRRLHFRARQRQPGAHAMPAVQAAILVHHTEQRFLLEDTLRFAEEEIAAGVESVMEHAEQPCLQFTLEVDEDVATTDQV